MLVVTYFRVSTAEQGRSGLGLEAQRASVAAFCRARGCEVLGEFVEVESGKRDDRPQLRAAMQRARVTGATRYRSASRDARLRAPGSGAPETCCRRQRGYSAVHNGCRGAHDPRQRHRRVRCGAIEQEPAEGSTSIVVADSVL